MRIDRGHVVQALRAGGRTEQARRAEEVLDVPFDSVRDADLLRELGIDPDHRAGRRRPRPARMTLRACRATGRVRAARG